MLVVTASNIAVNANIKAKFDGIIELENVRTIKTKDNDNNQVNIVMANTGEIKILDKIEKYSNVK